MWTEGGLKPKRGQDQENSNTNKIRKSVEEDQKS